MNSDVLSGRWLAKLEKLPKGDHQLLNMASNYKTFANDTS